jgi:ATP-dependent Clp protease ATP-binding subunit ClpX
VSSHGGVTCKVVATATPGGHANAVQRVRLDIPPFHLRQLDEPALVRILTEPGNALVRRYQRLFEFEGVGLEFTPDALAAIARQAIERGTGARGLRGVMEGLLRKAMYEMPSLQGATGCLVDEASVNEGKPLIISYGTKPINKVVEEGVSTYSAGASETG